MVEELVTPIILTFNEEPNIERTLSMLSWAKRIVVVDSGSTDATLDILSKYPAVELFHRDFDSFSGQLNYACSVVETPWVMQLDADHMLSEGMKAELDERIDKEEVDCFYTRFKFCIYGKVIECSVLPPRPLVFKNEKARYVDDGHAQVLVDIETSAELKNVVYHDDRKALDRWLWAQNNYMNTESKLLLEKPFSELSWTDRMRKLVFPAPFLMCVYCMIVRGGIFDGKAGFYYMCQRVCAEMILSMKIMERMYRKNSE